MPSLIPRSSYEVRPRLAVEIRPEGVYAARTADASGTLAQVARAELLPRTVVPSPRLGNIVDRAAVVAALRQTLGSLQVGKLRDVTLIVPDAAARVLLLDFDSLPSSVDDALPLIRFRLAKLLPFSPEAAQVSYQVMADRARQLQVLLIVAIPYEVLFEYEAAVREAGFEPGAVLPSTLAAASAVDDASQTAALLVNGSSASLTTAILRRGEILLHRTLDLQLPAYGIASGLAEGAIAVLPAPAAEISALTGEPLEYGADDPSGSEVNEGPVVEELAPLRQTLQERQQQLGIEVQQAVAVAAAYYEDSLAVPPEALLTSGSISAMEWTELLRGTGQGSTLHTRELLLPADVLPTATTPVAPGLLAALRGALRS